MTLVDIFEHILDGFNFNSEKVNHLIEKTENVVYTHCNKVLNTLS